MTFFALEFETRHCIDCTGLFWLVLSCHVRDVLAILDEAVNLADRPCPGYSASSTVSVTGSPIVREAESELAKDKDRDTCCKIYRWEDFYPNQLYLHYLESDLIVGKRDGDDLLVLEVARVVEAAPARDRVIPKPI